MMSGVVAFSRCTILARKHLGVVSGKSNLVAEFAFAECEA